MSQVENGRPDSLEDVSFRELRILEEVDSTPEVSQRHLSHQVGAALGVTNILLRNLAKKGYIRSSQVAWKRWVYVLTPAGISRKVQLTLAYVDRFLDHYRRVRLLVREDLKDLSMNPESRIAIYGTTDLTEFIFLALRDMGVTNIDIYDKDGSDTRFLGMPVHSLESLNPQDYVKVMVAYPGKALTRCQDLQDNGVEPDQIVTLLQKSTLKRGVKVYG